MKAVVTGGCGFIGSALVRCLVDSGTEVLNVDCLTYSGRRESVAGVAESKNYSFCELNICDGDRLNSLIMDFRPDTLFHLAAESHVDRSIDGPGDFIQTNIVGTFNVLQAMRFLVEVMNHSRLLHVSTDEVFGSIESGGFNELSSYRPNSPYSASKACSDHLVRAWAESFDLPINITNCSNNYGEYQFPEKLIPLTILNALDGKPIRIYGDGLQVRDWLYVQDHVAALRAVAENGELGRTYNVGGQCEKTNVEVVQAVLTAVSDVTGVAFEEYWRLVEYVKDRPGHDRRYAIDIGRIEAELNWRPLTDFDSGLKRTVNWYLENQSWTDGCRENYEGQRLGQARANL